MKDEPGVLTRRDFVRGTVGATLTASVLGPGELFASPPAPANASVVVVRNEKVFKADDGIDKGVLRAMLDQTLMQLSGQDSTKKAWATFVKPGDTVGLVPTDHLNPTHDELMEVVRQSLKQDAGLPADKVIDAQGGVRRPKRCSVLIGVPGLKAHW
jgi:hypothetical protein